MLTSLDPKKLRTFSNDRDLLRDLFTYLDYVGETNVKRMTRTNQIPRPDSVRIAKLMGDSELVNVSKETGGAQWIDFIDDLALSLGLVDYDVKGTYRGYTSSEPSFIENFITVNKPDLGKFLKLSPAGQEKKILDALIQAKSHSEYDGYRKNEFYETSILGALDSFGAWGSGTGLMPTLKFPDIRQFLLDVLKTCPPNQWLSVESLVAYLKAEHPYFLIPKNPPKDKWEKATTRYGNFYESKEQWSHNEKPIPDDDPDGFERVEGRYVERFLENIPLTMRFVDVAYNPAPYKGLMPSRGMLKAFRVNERFPRLMSGAESQPRLTVQPNFDVVIESDFYPAQIIQQVSALGEQVSSPNSGHAAYVGIFQLKKTFVAAEQVRQPDLDVIAMLEKLGGRSLPPNVKVELEEWAGHADQFTLYEGFALLESVNEIPEADKFTAERITPTLRLIRGNDGLFSTLKINAYAPLRIQHPTGGFAPLAESAISLFPKESAQEKTHRKPKQVKVSRSVSVRYQFPDEESFTSVQKMLAELRCPFQADSKIRAIQIQQKEQARFDEAVLKLRDTLIIEIE
ncbi:MAG: hypothetical protein HZB18_04950 [Chloroflexi bacterium]|nr:hypothetical protein [Chloroflexota bacterium]